MTNPRDLANLGGGFTQAGAGAVRRSVENKLKDAISVKDFGAVCDGVTNDAAAVAAANTAAAGLPLLFPGVTHIGSPVTITCPIVDTLNQLFTATSQVTIDNKMPVRPDWWGDVENTLNYATNALPVTGGTVKLANKTYKSNNHAYTFGSTNTTQHFSKSNVVYQGEKMPQLTNSCRALVNGTIIQDMIIAYANNIEFRDLGIDSGKTFCDLKYGGPPTAGLGEGLLLTFPDDANKNAASIRKNAILHNVIGLSYSPTTPTHAVIVGEGYKGVTCTGEVVGCYGVHGIVIKCSDVKADQFTSYCNSGEGVIIKSDAQASTLSYNIQINKIYVDAAGPSGWSPYATTTIGAGLYFNCAGNNIDRIQIGSFISSGYPAGINTEIFAGNTLANVQIDTISVDCTNLVNSVGVRLYQPSGGLINFCQFGKVHVRRCYTGVYAEYLGNGKMTSFDSINAANILDVVVDARQTAYLSVSAIYAEVVTNGIARLIGLPKLLFGQVFKDSVGAPMFTSSNGGLVPTLKNGWTQISNTDTFRIELEGGRVHMRGLIRPGSSNVFTTLPRWAWPTEPKRFLVQAYNSSTIVAADLVVAPNGDVTVNEITGSTSNCSNWLSLAGCSWTSQA
jgi:hypothetical protein